VLAVLLLAALAGSFSAVVPASAVVSFVFLFAVL